MMDFGAAIASVKAGHRVQRDAWGTSDPGQHVRLEGIDQVFIVYGDERPSEPYKPGSADLLAEDWSWVRVPDTGDATAGDPLAQRTYEGRQGPTIAQESVENGTVEWVDTASAGPVPVAPVEVAADPDGDGEDDAAD